MKTNKRIKIYHSRSFITMNALQPRVEAVAVQDGRIVAVGTLNDLTNTFGEDAEIDNTFGSNVVIAGLIDQHLHPLLGATTLTTEIIAPEQWVLPSKVWPAVISPAEYDERVRQSHSNLPSGEWLFSWGFHSLWHGEMSRQRLDNLVGNRPTAIWQRSVHEWFLNTAATNALGLTEQMFHGDTLAHTQLDFESGHFWENGWMILLAKYLAPVFFTRDRFERGLHQLVDYLHMNGVTAINEPGISFRTEPWDLYQSILGAESTPFLSTFMIDGRLQSVRGFDAAQSLDDARSQIEHGQGTKVRVVEKQVKLFADGAVVSQLMQMKEPYLDAQGNPDTHHHGEWMMEPKELKRMFDIYWDEGWQIHIHVNGDFGLEVLVEIIEQAQLRHPRTDHRTVIVHMATSTEALLDRIQLVGAIVSTNPYYPIGFADKYREFGLGPDRADNLSRSGSVIKRKIPLSYHSDLPISASDPLVMASWGINRVTNCGRLVASDQRISIDNALRAVTIEAANSWQREHDLGSIELGKWANFTVLDADPFLVDPLDIPNIGIIGTMFEGRWHPISAQLQQQRSRGQKNQLATEAPTGFCDHGRLCGCDVAQRIGDFVTE